MIETAIEVAKSAAPQFPYFTEEHDLIRKTVKRFCQEEIAPHSEEWDAAGIFPRELFDKGADLGLLTVPTEAAHWLR